MEDLLLYVGKDQLEIEDTQLPSVWLTSGEMSHAKVEECVDISKGS